MQNANGVGQVKGSIVVRKPTAEVELVLNIRILRLRPLNGSRRLVDTVKLSEHISHEWMKHPDAATNIKRRRPARGPETVRNQITHHVSLGRIEEAVRQAGEVDR